jgi:multimeric flavodoxin WrbA
MKGLGYGWYGSNMKILILNASPRRKGTTSIILTEMEKNVASEHFVDTVNINELRMKSCIGCLKCRPDKTCILPRDDAHILAEKVKKSDLLIIGSPVYWGNIPGPLKIFFDRNVILFENIEAKSMWKRPTPQLKGKKAFLVISCGSPYPYNLLGSQSKGTIRALKTILKSGGIKIIKVLTIPNSYNFSKKKKKYLQKARNIGNSLAI